MKLHQMIFSLILCLLRLNAKVYGPGASREVLRDLTGMWQQK